MMNKPKNPPNQATLPQWGLIFIEGEDAASFLQGQLSNSVLGLNRSFPPQLAQAYGSVRLTGYCSPKGRLLASAWLGLFPSDEHSADRFALFISRDIAATTAKRLSMFVLRSKVKVVDASSEWDIFGYCANPEELQHLTAELGQIGMRLPDVFTQDQIYARALIAQKNKDLDKSLNNDSTQWDHLEVMSAIPRIVQATQEQFVPQMINFESVAGVDFKKGCYPGQEIVARSQYRGAIKRRLQLAHTAKNSLGEQSIAPGVELFHSGDPHQPAGMVVLSSYAPQDLNRIDFQIECKLEALESGEIHLGSTAGPVLKIDALPYPLIEI
jgi:folate-binding protein YgfZ